MTPSKPSSEELKAATDALKEAKVPTENRVVGKFQDPLTGKPIEAEGAAPLNDKGFVNGKISKLVNDNIDDLFEETAPKIEADKEELIRILDGRALRPEGTNHKFRGEPLYVVPDGMVELLLAWRDKCLVAELEKALEKPLHIGGYFKTTEEYLQARLSKLKAIMEIKES